MSCIEKGTHSLFDGVILGRDSYLFIGIEDARGNEPNSHGIVWKLKCGNWTSIEINERLVACTVTEVDDYYFVSIAETGKELVVGESGVFQNIIAVGPHSPASNGPLTGVRCIGGQDVFAVGIARQVYRKSGLRTWIRVDETCKPDLPQDRARAAFLDIDGFSSDDIYAVGWDGEIWQFNGERWTRRTSPTNLMLFSVCCCLNGEVVACGQEGVILRGRDATWKVVEQTETSESLRAIVEFKGRLYVCSSDLLYLLRDDQLFGVTPDCGIGSYGKLTVASDHLLSVGLKDAAIFDGASWERLF